MNRIVKFLVPTVMGGQAALFIGGLLEFFGVTSIWNMLVTAGMFGSFAWIWSKILRDAYGREGE